MGVNIRFEIFVQLQIVGTSAIGNRGHAGFVDQLSCVAEKIGEIRAEVVTGLSAVATTFVFHDHDHEVGFFTL